jgi:hypothetical protein
MKMDYAEFIESKKHISTDSGFEPLWMPDDMFDFQKHITEKAIRRGRMGVFIDTGLGKTRIALTVAQNIVMKTNKRVLILTPLAVAFQFLKEAELIGIDDIEHTKDGNFTKKIVLCNYERLHHLKSEDFICVIADESGILKGFNGMTRTAIIKFVRKTLYRFLLTATPSPNDFTELGNSSECLGELGYMDMLNRFFANVKDTVDSRSKNIGESYYLKPHAKNSFFEWLNTWCVMIKKPSDIGFSDDRYILPPLNENVHIVKSKIYSDESGQISFLPIEAKQLHEVRHEQKETVEDRCNKAVELTGDRVSVYWCNLNEESKTLKELDKGAVEIIGSQSIEQKENILKAFIDGEIPRIISKSTITGFGLNFQFCNHCIYFPTFSYEQYYQSVRRFWRFGQSREVTVDLVLSEGQKRILQALEEKKAKAQELYDNLIANVNADFKLKTTEENSVLQMPAFLSKGA